MLAQANSRITSKPPSSDGLAKQAPSKRPGEDVVDGQQSRDCRVGREDHVVTMLGGIISGGRDSDKGTEQAVTTPGPSKPTSLEVLIDDVRRFRDERPCLVARTSADGVVLLDRLRARRIDHLWLDHDLIGDDTIWPVIRVLEDAALQGRPFDIGMAHVQAARAGPAHRIVTSLRRVGYPVGRSSDLGMWTR